MSNIKIVIYGNTKNEDEAPKLWTKLEELFGADFKIDFHCQKFNEEYSVKFELKKVR